MNVQSRYHTVLELLCYQGKVQVTELSEHMGVSEMTVRRDLEAMEREGLLRRVHGGAVPVASGSYEPGFAVRRQLHAEVKARIGARAAELIGQNETIVIDAGTTALAAAKALRGKQNLTVCALSVHAAAELGDDHGIRLIVAGGDIRAGDQCFVGPLAERIFDDFHFDTFILTVGGIEADGLTDFYPEDVRLKRIAAANVRRRIVVADGGKLGRTKFARIGPATLADVVITDSAAPSHVVEELRGLGIRVEVV
jgi:DeoR/GlpR family transcriptional regulator of sugar metabolism